MKFKVIVHKADEGGFWAEVPAIKGCYTQGETMEEVVENVREAIEASRKIYIGPRTIVTPAARELASRGDILVLAERS